MSAPTIGDSADGENVLIDIRLGGDKANRRKINQSVQFSSWPITVSLINQCRVVGPLQPILISCSDIERPVMCLGVSSSAHTVSRVGLHGGSCFRHRPTTTVSISYMVSYGHIALLWAL
jgi:hypothetical protein